MHEDSPKMSVTQSLAASSSLGKNDSIVLENAIEYDLNITEAKPLEHTIEIEITYPTNEYSVQGI
ncbi:unnamed protein product [Leptidea sinapis]|uniref:Uncharacterized protein n=1 Tax=Leptidea sinapis TaxID=189913 RepID=A0A5E4PK14_9NEOP|nr:unnamed protein product [Leptidea sinapis]